MSSRYVATSSAQFLRKIALDYIRYGYIRYALREIPAIKDVEAVDRKLIECYQITSCRSRRARRRAQKLSNVVYVRYGHTFVLLATEGKHQTFDQIMSHNFRIAPLLYQNYSIGIHSEKPDVRVRAMIWSKVKRRFEMIALHEKTEVQRKLNALPFARFPGIIRQKRKLVHRINARRKRAGLAMLELPRFSQQRRRI